MKSEKLKEKITILFNSSQLLDGSKRNPQLLTITRYVDHGDSKELKIMWSLHALRVDSFIELKKLL